MTTMTFNQNFLGPYLNEAPIPLAYERVFECEILSKKVFQRPVLDIGCGDGMFARILFKEKIDTGIDPQAQEIESAKTYGAYTELIETTGDKLPKPDNYFNTVFSNSVLEHIEDLDPVLKEVHRVLSPEGYFYVTLPTDFFDKYSVVSTLLTKMGLNGIAARFNAFFNRFWRHYHTYDRAGWIQKFEKNGFKVIEVQEYGHPKDCLFNDFMIPFTFPSFVAKKLVNRFFFAPSLRRLYSPILSAALEKKVQIYPDLREGGLIFLALKKT